MQKQETFRVEMGAGKENFENRNRIFIHVWFYEFLENVPDSDP